MPEITPDIPYSEPAKCYDLCHLSDNITELITDSLSKYKFDKCPDKGSIAEEVRSDPLYCQLSESVNKSTDQIAYDVPTEFPNGEFDIETSKPPTSTTSQPTIAPTKTQDSHVHLKKLNELKEVLAVYKSQPRTHSFAHHSPRRA